MSNDEIIARARAMAGYLRNLADSVDEGHEWARTEITRLADIGDPSRMIEYANDMWEAYL